MKKIEILSNNMVISPMRLFAILVLVVFVSFGTKAQVREQFTPRTSVYSPTKQTYNLEGDFTIIGNTNLTLVSYTDNKNNSNNTMTLVDADGDAATSNSSSATLVFSTENGANPNCSDVVFAGLYWTGRGNNLTTTAMRTIKLKAPGGSYQTLVANVDEIRYPGDNEMYAGYIEVTDIVKAAGQGDYWVADMALSTGNGGSTGYYGGWGLVVVYKNSRMKWRDITVFDGYAYVIGGTAQHTLDVSGFKAVQSGDVNVKMGFMAGEGDVGISGDYFQIQRQSDNNYLSLSHAGNSTNNFFNSSVETGGNSRTPNLNNNTGLDISMFDIPNTNNAVITNNQTTTRFRYGSTQDTYIIFCIVFGVDAYIPEPEGIISISAVGGSSGSTTTVLPGEEIEYTIEIRNIGTEAINDVEISIPLPFTTSYVEVLGEKYYGEPANSSPTFKPNVGATGTISWDFGDLPLLSDQTTLLGKLTFSLTATDDCFILSNPNCEPEVMLNGSFSGTGVTSNTYFSGISFIQGYESSGTCAGEPIDDPLTILIDRDDFVNTQCNGGVGYTTRQFTYCNVAGSTIPFTDVIGNFPAGSRFYNELPTGSNNPTEYTTSNSFPATEGTLTYYAVPPGDTDCYWQFTISVTSITSTPTVSPVSYCLGETAVPLTAIPSDPSYTLYYYTSETDVTPETSITPSTVTAGTYTFWVAEGKSGQCISPNRAQIVVTVNSLPQVILTVENGTCPDSGKITVGASGNGAFEYSLDGGLNYQSSDTFTGLSTGNYTVTVKDANGCTVDETCSVTAEDAQSPVIVALPTDISVNNDADVCGATVSWTEPTSGDNCSGSSLAQTAGPANGGLFPIGTSTVEYTATDASGNTTVETFDVTVTDAQSPVIVALPTDISVDNDADVCGATVSWTEPTSGDNCSGSSLAQTAGPANGGLFPIGTSTVEYTATDASGNTTVETFDVTVTDAQSPVIVALPTDISVDNDADVCGATVSWTEPTSGDNCSGSSLAQTAGPANGGLFPIGTSTVEYTATDASGNTTVETFDVTVTDAQSPVIVALPTDISVNNDADVCGATVSWTEPTSGDNCSGSSLAQTAGPANGGLFPIGTSTVEYTATDASGNTTVETFDVTVTDAQSPVIVALPTDISVDNDADVCGATVSWTEPTSGDNCSGSSLAQTAGPANGGLFPIGTSTVEYTATDASGNTTVETFDVTVTDAQSPVIVALPTDISVDNDADVCGATVSWTEPTSGDNCSGSSLAQTAGPANGGLFPIGTSTVEYTATDASGNTTVETFDVTVTDDEDPTITCAGDQTQTADAGEPNAAVVVNAPATSDNCGVAGIVNDFNNTADASGTYPVGTTPVTWTVTDIHGNTSTCVQNITVTDEENPTISCSVSSQTQTADAGVCQAAVTVVAPAVTDNTAVASLTNDYNGTADASDTYPVGTTTVTWTVTDEHGNTSQCSQDVTVTDDEDPTITCAGDQTQTADAGEPNAAVVVNAPATSDNCGVAGIVNDFNNTADASGTYPVGTTPVTWTVTDIHGNTSTCVQNITVTDEENPTISCSVSSQTQTADAGVCQAAVTVVAPAVTDNTAVASLTNDYNGTADASDTYPVGTTTVTWTVTDEHGNTSQCSQDVTVTDDEDPTITCAGDQTQTADAGEPNAAVVVNAPATSDNCGVAGIVNDFNNTADASGTYPVGTTPVTWTVTDIHGNTSTCVQNITVTDEENPTISCSVSSQTQTADAGVCQAAVTVVAPAVTDNTAVASLTNDYNGTADASDTYPVGTTTVTWTVTDEHGNTSQCSQDVTVTDDEDPTITCAGDQTQTADAGEPNAAVVVNAPATSDNCGVAGIVNDFNNTADASGTYPVGTTPVTWTVTDIHGNTSTCVQNITVTDEENPTISCSVSSQTQTADAGVCQAAVTVVAPAVTDNTAVASLTNDYNGTADASDTYPVGTTTVTWTVTDEHGNTSQCSQDVTVTDDEDPTITCAGDQTQTADAGEPNAAVVVNAPATSDNCGVAGIVNDFNNTADASGTYPVGTTPVTWTVTDIHGNTSTCVQNITVTDEENPTISCSVSSQTQTADAGVCQAAVTVVAPAVTDNTAVASLTNDYNGTADASDTYPVGTTTVTWTVTDEHGNTSQCSQDVTVTDDEDPTITCAGDQTQTADAGEPNAAVVVNAPATSDNCGVAGIVNDFNNTADASGTYPVGTTPVTWTVTDIHGNTSTCVQNITVTDEENPTISCSVSSQTQTADAGVCQAAVTVVAPAVTDNTAVASLTNDYNGTADASDTYPVGTTTVTWTVTDEHGNTSQCSQDVTVTDDEDPTITCAGDQTQTADAGEPNAAVVVNAPATSDNCGVAGIVNDFNNTADASGTYPVGTTPVTWTVTDIHGNTSTCVQNITVTDEENPTISCSVSSQTQTADAGVCQAAVTVVAPAVTDNTAVASLTNDYNGTADASDTYPVGTTTVTWTVTDEHGNTSQCSQDVTVTDDEDPTITCAGDQTQTADAGEPNAAVVVNAPATSDNCGVAGIVNDFNNTADASGTYPVGTTPVTWTVTDIHGNTSTCVQNITVTDEENPTISCSVSSQTQTADAGVCQAAVTVVAPAVTDNTAVASLTNDYNGTADASDTYPVGTTTVTWTVTDEHGNTSQCSQDVTVTDDEDPTITCAGDQTQTADAGEPNAAVVVNAPATSDNCGVAGIVNDFNNTADASGTYPVGTTPVTWTVTDIHGNTSTCVQNITVTDEENPTISCSVSSQTQTADAGVCQAAVTVVAPAVTDNTAVASLTNDYNGTADASDTYPVGTTTVTWTVTDEHGNTSQCSQDVTVTDDEDPTITCAGDQTQTADAGEPNAAVVVNAPATSDNCGVAGIVNDFNNTADASGTYPVGTTPVTWTVTDIHGNTSTCVQNITVTDEENPTISCSVSSQTQTADAGVCQAAVTVVAPAVTDNTAVASLTNDYNGTADASDTYPVGTTTVTWTVTDEHGNTSQCSQDVTVTDDEDPTITCAGDQTQTADAGEPNAAVVVNAPATSDNCGVAGIVNDFNNTADASGTYPVGTTPVTWTVTDIHGNTSTCVQNITVTDEENPTISCSVSSQTQTADAGVCQAAVTVVAPAVTDNTAVASLTNDYNGTADASDTYPVGTTTVTWTVTDEHGNTSQCSQDVTVTDDEDPTITCAGDQTQTADAGEPNAAVVVNAPATSDNCGVAGIVNDFNNTADASGTYPVGTTPVTWTVTDIHGNTSTCVQNITVTDEENPTISCSVSSQTQTADAGVCQAAVTVVAPAVTDNTAVASLTNDYNGTADASDTYPVGTTTVTWTVTDEHGNTSQCSQLIMVIDDQLPAITCGGDISETIISSADCDHMITVPTPNSSDNCTVESIVNDFNGLDDASAVYPFGTTIVVWTATDVNGNQSTCTQTITLKSEPVAVDDGQVIEEDTEVTIDVLANDLDCDDNIDVSTLAIVSNASNGTTTVNADGTITYLPNLNYFGTDNFTYQICDADGYCSTATVTIQVLSVYDPPISMGDINNTFSGMATGGNVFTNDVYHETGVVSGPSITGEKDAQVSRLKSIVSSETGKRLSTDHTAVKLTDPDHGILTLNEDGTYIYEADASYSGDDQFTYAIMDNVSGVSTPAIVYLRVIDKNHLNVRPPVANADIYMAVKAPEYPLEGNILANDFDMDAGALVVNTTPIVAPAVGELQLSSDGQFTYNAPANYEGVVTFTYEVQKQNDPSSTATAEVLLIYASSDQDGGVFGVDDAYETDKNYAITKNASINDVNISSGAVTMAVQTEPTHGTVAMSASGEFTYTPDADYVGPDNFTYSICVSGSTLCRNATVYISVDETNMPPVAVDDDFIMTDENKNVLDNDYDPDGDEILVTSITVEPEHGTLVWNADGTFTYTPDEFYYGDDSFEYEVCDNAGAQLCDQAVVTLRHDPQIDVLKIPNAFSPNGDGKNDYLEVLGIHMYSNAHIEIYNRWGAKLFEMDDYGNEQLLGTSDAWWDGRPNVGGSGDIVPEGTYFVILILDNIVHKGTVFVKR